MYKKESSGKRKRKQAQIPFYFARGQTSRQKYLFIISITVEPHIRMLVELVKRMYGNVLFPVSPNTDFQGMGNYRGHGITFFCSIFLTKPKNIKQTLI